MAQWALGACLTCTRSLSQPVLPSVALRIVILNLVALKKCQFASPPCCPGVDVCVWGGGTSTVLQGAISRVGQTWDEGSSRECSEQGTRLSQSTVSHGVLTAPAPSSEVQRELRRSPDLSPKPAGQKAA